MDNKINRHFCIQPFVNSTTRVDGTNYICCNIRKSDSHIDNETPASFFRSKYRNEFRKKILNGEKLTECGLCHYQEEKSKNSQRIEYNKYYNILNDRPIDYYKNMLDKLRISDLENPLYSDIHVSNLCNLKCLSCNDKDSSKITRTKKRIHRG